MVAKVLQLAGESILENGIPKPEPEDSSHQALLSRPHFSYDVLDYLCLQVYFTIPPSEAAAFLLSKMELIPYSASEEAPPAGVVNTDAHREQSIPRVGGQVPSPLPPPLQPH